MSLEFLELVGYLVPRVSLLFKGFLDLAPASLHVAVPFSVAEKVFFSDGLDQTIVLLCLFKHIGLGFEHYVLPVLELLRRVNYANVFSERLLNHWL